MVVVVEVVVVAFNEDPETPKPLNYGMCLKSYLVRVPIRTYCIFSS